MRITLLPGERVLVRTRPSALPLLRPVLAGFLLLGLGSYGLGYLSRDELSESLTDWQPVLLLSVLALLLVLLVRLVVWPFLRWSSNHYVLTTTRLIHRYGVLRRTVNQISLFSISQLQTDQGLLQRMVGSGTLVMVCGFDRAPAYRHVPQLEMFKEYVEAAISELPRARGFDGVDMEIDPRYARGGMPGWHQERRDEQS